MTRLPRPGKLVPFGLQKRLLERALSAAFREPLAGGALDFLERRWLRVVIVDLGADWLITRGTQGLVLLDGGIAADVTFSGKLRDFVLLATRRQDPDSLFFQRRLRVSGDTELGLHCKNLLDSLEEERLPPLLAALMRFAGRLAGADPGPRLIDRDQSPLVPLQLELRHAARQVLKPFQILDREHPML